MRKALFIGIFFQTVSAIAGPIGPDFSDIIPADRRIDWSNAGILQDDGTRGIPHRTNICATMTPSNTSAEINKAIKNCSNGVVLLGPGTYNLESIDFAGKSNVTLRGSGPDRTKLTFSKSVACGGAWSGICLGAVSTFWTGNLHLLHPEYIHDWVGGYGKGETELTLGDATGLNPGMVIVLDQIDDAADTGTIFVNQVKGIGSIEGGSPGRTVPGGHRAQQQYVKVVEVSTVTNKIKINPGLYMPNWRASQQPQAWYLGRIGEMNGVEDMTLDHTTAPGLSGIGIANAYNCWVKNVKSLNSNRNHIWVTEGARAEVRDSYFYGTKHGESQSYGVEFYGASDSLVTNNIFQHVTTPIMSGAVWGAVVAYNYMIDMYYFNYSGRDNNFLQPGISMAHDAGTGMNLFEGNMTNAIQSDLFHGSSALPTAFRNEIIGWETFVDKTTGQVRVKNNTSPIQINSLNRYANIVGNVIGKDHFHTKYEDSLVPPATPGDFIHSIYYLGYAGCCEQKSLLGVPYDPLVVTTMLRWGNFDYATKTTRWENSEMPDGAAIVRQLPKSLFLSSQPSGWQTPWGTPPWPPIGGDLTPLVSDIPAKLCYDHTPRDSNGILLFDAKNCYATTRGPLPVTKDESAGELSSMELIPNPFNPTNGPLQISLDMTTDAHVTMVIHERFGKKVIDPIERDLSSGPQTIEWDGRNKSGEFVASGSYIVVVTSGEKVHKKILVVVK